MQELLANWKIRGSKECPQSLIGSFENQKEILVCHEKCITLILKSRTRLDFGKKNRMYANPIAVKRTITLTLSMSIIPIVLGTLDPKYLSSTTVATSTSTSAGTTTAAGTTGGGSNISISQAEFDASVTSCGYPKTSDDKYNAFSDGLAKSTIKTKREAAMLLAQILHESKGLSKTAEELCQTNLAACNSAYPSLKGGLPGKSYYGRGYIQLTWDYNYIEASKDLYGNDDLLKNPESVATDEKKAWGVTFWYWGKKVSIVPDVQNGKFGAATRAINGALECTGGSHPAVAKRNENYAKCLKAFGINETPDFSGC